MGYEAFSFEEKNQFKHIYEYCLAMCARFISPYKKAATTELNTVRCLEHAILETYEDQIMHQEQLRK